MVEPTRKGKLKKELKLLDVYAIATGTTLSAGFFLLPGIAAAQAGPAIVIAYLIAAIPLIPATLSILELATAMPRAGGVYYFLDRTLGPAFGTIGGIGTWLALILKVAFALIGMGAYTRLFFPDLTITPIAIGLAIVLGLLNYFSAKKTGGLQVFLVFGLLILLIVFISGGIPEIKPEAFQGFMDSGWSSILSTAGLVYISYVGVTNVASLSEEISHPERNMPLGVLLALATAIVIYGLGTAVMVGVIPMNELAGNLTPVATAAGKFLGKYGAALVSIAAMLAFISVANAGTLSASRYPLAMSRDHMLPRIFVRLGKRGSPYISLLTTVSAIILILILFDPTKIAKLASTFQLLMFGMVCLAVIVIRESRIESYDPGFKSLLYPYMQIFGIFSSLTLIFRLGLLPMIFSVALISVGFTWYWYYARHKVVRNGAIYHIFARLGQQRYEGLDTELRGILKEKGLRDEDPFDEIVARSYVIDLDEDNKFENIVDKASAWLSQIIPVSKDEIEQNFLEGTRIGATPVTRGIALPHFRTSRIERAELVLVRSKKGVYITYRNPLLDYKEDIQKVYGVFFLVSSESNPTQHLRILAQIAGHVDDDSFYDAWMSARNEPRIKEVLLRDERFLSIKLTPDTISESLIGKKLREGRFPKGCLVAMIWREGRTLIPQGSTILKPYDRLTILGDPRGLGELRKQFKDEFNI